MKEFSACLHCPSASMFLLYKMHSNSICMKRISPRRPIDWFSAVRVSTVFTSHGLLSLLTNAFFFVDLNTTEFCECPFNPAPMKHAFNDRLWTHQLLKSNFRRSTISPNINQPKKRARKERLKQKKWLQCIIPPTCSYSKFDDINCRPCLCLAGEDKGVGTEASSAVSIMFPLIISTCVHFECVTL